MANASSQGLQHSAIVSAHEYTHQSSVLKQERRFLVSLPERYFASDRHYPTLYIIDADFQFQHVSALVKHLARMGKIPPMIVVGVANQGDDDYLYTTTWATEDKAFGGAAEFHHYLTNELVPLIDREFKSNSQKALAGYSLGGLFTLYSMMQQDSPFNAYLAMSPSAWFDDYSVANKIESLLQQNKLSAPLFFSVAREEDMGVDKVAAVFEASADKSLQWHFESYPTENHFTTALPALYDGLQFLAPNYATDGTDMLEIGDYKAVIKHFKTLQKQWGGFQFEWLHAYQFAKYLFWSKQVDKVDEILTAIEQHFPESVTIVSIEVAKGLLIKGDNQHAKTILEKVTLEGEQSPNWHKQLSLYYKAEGDEKRAQQHFEKALALAEKYQLESWEVWELK
ncbi:alpha/beta hydrolase-fold protein [Shewanella kaireitica]|uniref:alpha/beta hydrolase-fold protein n=1 Tax=Shewanella kaireitica TaxID=212021 RepID=UPI00200E2746|nr:alpha/beta hydrolase-fold protein [Shewanella kaireitica]MCL1094011.1 alpha/beta hydrolase [Shewanella kaireitica]